MELRAGGNIILEGAIIAGDFAATTAEAAALRTSRQIADNVQLRALNDIILVAGGRIYRTTDNSRAVNLAGDQLTLQAGSGIENLRIGVNELTQASTASGSIGLEVVESQLKTPQAMSLRKLTADGAVSVTATQGLLVTELVAGTGQSLLAAGDGPLTMIADSSGAPRIQAMGSIRL